MSRNVPPDRQRKAEKEIKEPLSHPSSCNAVSTTTTSPNRASGIPRTHTQRHRGVGEFCQRQTFRGRWRGKGGRSGHRSLLSLSWHDWKGILEDMRAWPLSFFKFMKEERREEAHPHSLQSRSRSHLPQVAVKKEMGSDGWLSLEPLSIPHSYFWLR